MNSEMPCFNELTAVVSSPEVMEERLREYVRILERLRSYGVRKILYDCDLKDIRLTKTMSLEDLCAKVWLDPNFYHLRSIIGTLVDMRQYPSKAEQQERYNRYSNVSLMCNDVAWPDMPLGLYAAHVLDTYAVGFSDDTQDAMGLVCKLKLTWKKEKENAKDKFKEEEVYHLTKMKDFEDDDFTWYLATKDIKVSKAGRKDEAIDLPPHHGQKECTEHAKILIQNEFVEAILNSIDHVRSERKYIHKVYPDGKIEVRLHWQEGGYGLLIATAGRDIVQTKWIALHLQERYGHM